MDDVYQLDIITPEKIFLSEQVQSISIDSPDGRLEVLKGHVPCVIAVSSGIMSIKRNDIWENAACSEGFMEVRPDKAIMLLETAEWAGEIDRVRAERAAEIAAEELRQKQSMREYRESKAMIARAMARLRVVNRNNVNMD